jgi:Holliday junction resolvasome RuvABC DNA-binding subunit
VLELRDKVTDIFAGETLPAGRGPSDFAPQDVGGDAYEEVIAVLMSLGYSRSEAATAMLNVKEEYATVEAGVKLALKHV